MKFSHFQTTSFFIYIFSWEYLDSHLHVRVTTTHNANSTQKPSKRASFSNKISANFFISLNKQTETFRFFLFCFLLLQLLILFILSFLFFLVFHFATRQSCHGTSQQTVARSILHGKRTNTQPSRRGASLTRSVSATYERYSCRIRTNGSTWISWRTTSGIRVHRRQQVNVISVFSSSKERT